MTEVTNLEEIWNKYSDHNGKKPWLVISVIGDSNSFVPTTWEKTLFQTSLIETAKGAKGNFKPLLI
jgi:SH3-like domain-containing protein